MENKTHLLLVDDEQDVTQLLCLRLTRRGYACFTAESGEAALEVLSAKTVHVVIMDVKMPGMGGVAALAHMRKDWPRIPVILLSGHADMQTAVTAMESGAFGYLMKPVDFEELLFKLRMLPPRSDWRRGSKRRSPAFFRRRSGKGAERADRRKWFSLQRAAVLAVSATMRAPFPPFRRDKRFRRCKIPGLPGLPRFCARPPAPAGTFSA